MSGLDLASASAASLFGAGNVLGSMNTPQQSPAAPASVRPQTYAFGPEISHRYAAPDGAFGNVNHTALRQSFADLGMTPDDVMTLRRAATAPTPAAQPGEPALTAASTAVAPHPELAGWLQRTGTLGTFAALRAQPTANTPEI